MDIMEALKLLRVKGFTGPMEISTGVSDNTVEGEHLQTVYSKVIIYDMHVMPFRGEHLEDVVRKQILKQS